MPQLPAPPYKPFRDRNLPQHIFLVGIRHRLRDKVPIHQAAAIVVSHHHRQAPLPQGHGLPGRITFPAVYIPHSRINNSAPCCLKGYIRRMPLRNSPEQGMGEFDPGPVHYRFPHANHVRDAVPVKPSCQAVLRIIRMVLPAEACRQHQQLNAGILETPADILLRNRNTPSFRILKQKTPPGPGVVVFMGKIPVAAHVNHMRPESLQPFLKGVEPPVIRHLQAYLPGLLTLQQGLLHRRLLRLHIQAFIVPQVIRQRGKQQHPQGPLLRFRQIRPYARPPPGQSKPRRTADKDLPPRMIQGFPGQGLHPGIIGFYNHRQDTQPCLLLCFVQSIPGLQRLPKRRSHGAELRLIHPHLAAFIYVCQSDGHLGKNGVIFQEIFGRAYNKGGRAGHGYSFLSFA